MTTFYGLRFETSPTWRARYLYLCPIGNRWPDYNPRHWVPFSSPPATRQGYGGSIRPRLHTIIGFEVLAAVVTKSNILWDITPCSPLKINRRFRGTFCLISRLFLPRLILRPWRWRRYVPPKRWLTERTTRRYIPEDSTLQSVLIVMTVHFFDV
jgi:hypothetical protein